MESSYDRDPVDWIVVGMRVGPNGIEPIWAPRHPRGPLN